MKYRIAIILHVYISALCLYAQVGINTVNPQGGTMHIDSQGNNPALGVPSAVEQEDDIFIDANGNVGLGNVSPVYRLDLRTTAVAGGVKIQDGTEGTSKVLQSDANGFGSWKYEGMPLVKGFLPVTGITMDPVAASVINTFIYTGAYIDLPPGQWVVMINLLLYTSGAPSVVYKQRTWMRTTFMDTPTATDFSTSIVGSFLASGTLFSTPNGIIQGNIVLNNATSASKRYYYAISYIDQLYLPSTVRISNFASGASNQNSMIAVKMK